MAYTYLLSVDPAELDGRIKPEQQMWLNEQYEVEKYLPIFSREWPQNTICIYKLSEIQKFKTQPTYQRYELIVTGKQIGRAHV